MTTVAASICGLMLCYSCKKAEKPLGVLTIQVSHVVDQKPVQWDKLLYTNQAGNLYSIERLQYFLSDFSFYANKKPVAHVDSVIYIDARIQDNRQFAFKDFPWGYIDSISFLIGVPTDLNVPNGLPATMENAVMEWPEMMGGGYHFLKLEGRWQDGVQTPGYAMHLGKPGYQVRATMRCSYFLRETNAGILKMTMNVNEWFRNPHTYNFADDGVYTMGNETLMKKLQENGANVFSQN